MVVTDEPVNLLQLGLSKCRVTRGEVGLVTVGCAIPADVNLPVQHAYQQAMSLVVWDAEGRLLAHQGTAPLPPFARGEGFATLQLGTPPQAFLDTEKAVLEGVAAALDTVKPGATCEEVEAAWRTTVARYGIEKASRIGYSVGLSYPPDWGERTMSLRPGDRSVLQPGMTFHLIPAIWRDDWGLEITETFLVTETGHETLCNFPRRLFVKP